MLTWRSLTDRARLRKTKLINPLLNIALNIVHGANNILTREFDHIAAYPSESLAIIAKLRLELQAKILTTVQEPYPQHAVLFPGYEVSSSAETVWLIDILSGVDNYAHAIPHFAICIAIKHQHKIEHSVIHDPLLNETFIASRNKPAQLNKFRIHVNDNKTGVKQLLWAGNQLVKLQAYAEPTPFNSRQTGCNALMLAYVASGRFDGFAGDGLSEFEVAAGSLLIKMAGGAYSDLAGGNAYTEKRELLATNPKLFKLLLQEIALNSKAYP